MKTSLPRVHGLDTLRSVAIVSVIIFHVQGYGGDGKIPDWLLPAARMGWMGVDLFFVLSGYLIGSQLLRPYTAGKHPGIWSFYRKRFYRVLPAYFLVLGLYLFVPAWREMPALAPVWSFLTFTLNLVIGRFDAYAFSHAWSLCVEEHFYLVLPLIVLALMRKPSARKCAMAVGGFVLFGICLRTYILFHWIRPLAHKGESFSMVYLTRIYYPTYSHFDGLIAGVVLAAIMLFRPAWWKSIADRGHTLFAGALALVAVSIWLFNDRFVSADGVSAIGTIIGYPLLSTGLALLVASALTSNGILARYKVPGAKLIATLAYSLYLTHKEMIHLVSDRFPIAEQWGTWRWMSIYAACCFAVAAALYLCIERPFLQLRDRRKPSGQILDPGI